MTRWSQKVRGRQHGSHPARQQLRGWRERSAVSAATAASGISDNPKLRGKAPRDSSTCAPGCWRRCGGKGSIKGPARQKAEGTGLPTQNRAQPSETLPGERDFQPGCAQTAQTVLETGGSEGKGPRHPPTGWTERSLGALQGEGLKEEREHESEPQGLREKAEVWTLGSKGGELGLDSRV